MHALRCLQVCCVADIQQLLQSVAQQQPAADGLLLTLHPPAGTAFAGELGPLPCKASMQRLRQTAASAMQLVVHSSSACRSCCM